MKKNNKPNFKGRLFMSPTFLTFMAYPSCGMLDIMLNGYLDNGIKYAHNEEYYIFIEFNNGDKCRLWNANKYYGWLSRGYIGNFCWERSRPKKSTMRRFRYELEQYYKNKQL